MHVLFALLIMSMTASIRHDSAVEEAVKLVNQGNVEKGLDFLQGYLSKNAKDVQARVVLGEILDFDGRPEEAVSLWERGLGNDASDLPLLMSVGEIRFRQGRDGPNITYRRGMVAAHPGKKGDDEEAYKAKQLEQAAKAYGEALRLLPKDRKITTALANVYGEQKKYDDASNLWKSLVDASPKDAELRLSFALAAKNAGRLEEAMTQLERAVGINPHLATAHGALAEIQEAKGLKTEADLSRKRSEFYEALPSFCTLDFTDANRTQLARLNEEQAVKKLVADPSDEATQLLAVLCWSHPHNLLEADAFKSLEERGEKTTPVLQAMLEDARSTCTIKSAAHILARRKVEGLLDFLTKRLPGDLRMLGMDMDIAGSLDDLGDPRAVGPLVDLLNLKDADAGANEGMLSDRKSAQGRAVLALGAFPTPESKGVLEAARRIPRLRPYAVAALYRQTKKADLIADLEASIGPDDLFATYIVGDYLNRKVGTEEAKTLAGKWKKRREEAEAQRKERDEAEKKTAK